MTRMNLEFNDFDALVSRLGEEAVRRRLTVQAEYSARIYGGFGRYKLHFENSELFNRFVFLCLKLTGLIGYGVRNALEFETGRVETGHARLPQAFNGFRILHLSDLHIDAFPSGPDMLTERLEAEEFDICVITGDYRFRTYGDDSLAIERMKPLVGTLQKKGEVLGITGNHDFLEIVPPLESMGVRMLMNESVRISRGNQSIVVAGVDDAHFYGSDDLQKALSGISGQDFKVLLSHTPETCFEAQAAGIDFFLCGHTHGGQMCLPGGIPLMTNAGKARKYASGLWRIGKMTGYTSRGLGSSGVFARFFCAPEITVHTLTCG